MVKLFSTALVLTALTVPVSMSNLGTSSDSITTEQQSGLNSGQIQTPPQQMGLTPIEVQQPQTNSQNSLRESPAASWQPPQFENQTDSVATNEFEKRFRSNAASPATEFGNQPVNPAQAANPEIQYPVQTHSSTVQDRSVMQAAWEQQPGNGGFNPTTSQPGQPAGPGNQSSGLDPAAAKNILVQLEQFSQTRTMPGTPLTMEEALHQTTPESRTRMVAAYWQAWRDRYLLTISEQKFQQFRQMDEAGTFGMQGSLALQLRNAETGMISRQLALRRSQGELKQFFPALLAGDYLPLPVDMPVTAGYETHYEWYANNGQGNAELKQLDQTLPIVLELVQEKSDTAWRVSRSAEQIMQMAMSGQATLEQFVATLDRAQQTSADCLESLRQYNATIADYSMALRPDIQSSFELARMLVPSRSTNSVNVATQPARTADMRVNLPVQPAGNSQPFSNGGFNPASRNQNIGDPNSRLDSSRSGGTFQPMELPGSGNPANQPLAPRSFQNPGQQFPPIQSVGSGG